MINDIIKHTLRVPVSVNSTGDGLLMTSQLDGVLLKVGFCLSKPLFTRLAALPPVEVKELSKIIISAVNELLGNDVKHNVYFKQFPNIVPDTLDFWISCIVDAYCNYGIISPFLNDLPKYGRYQHTYEDMVAVHDAFIATIPRPIKVLHLGQDLSTETINLYKSLAESTIPLNEYDRKLVANLAEVCPDTQVVPTIRENRAIINAIKLTLGRPISVDTATDVLRIACALSNGDITLATNTKFKSFPRRIRRELVKALNSVESTKMSDIGNRKEQFKRLFERLHIHSDDMPINNNSLQATKVAFGITKMPSINSEINSNVAIGNVIGAIKTATIAPSILARNFDRLLTLCSTDREQHYLFDALLHNTEKISGRVLLSLREHLLNRSVNAVSSRIFTNSKGKSYVIPESRKPLLVPSDFETELDKVIAQKFINHLQISKYRHAYIDDKMADVALPLSDKNKETGFSIFPRGSKQTLNTEILRFFMHWHQKSERTDYDLSAIMTDATFTTSSWIDWTRLSGKHGKHSGDITHAENGASEFIDIMPSMVDRGSIIIPQVNIYAGESFSDVKESFFGYMTRSIKEKGLPYEPRTVEMKSDIRGKGKVAMPLIFIVNDDYSITAKWTHAYGTGISYGNTAKNNRFSTFLLIKSIYEREYLTVKYFLDLMIKYGSTSKNSKDPFFYLTANQPENLSSADRSINLTNLQELIPA